MQRMNNKRPILMGGAPQVNLDEMPYLECPNHTVGMVTPTCGNNTFDRVELIKKISAIMSPTGKDHFVTLPVYRCSKCGFLLEGKEYPRPTPVVAQVVRV